MTSDPKTIALSLLFGIIPSLLWLWFWLREDKKNPEPKGILTGVFFLGMMAVVFVLPIQQFIKENIISYHSQVVLWATAEEIIKYIAVIIIIRKTNLIDEPVDWPIYLMTSALGFASLENVMFLIKPLSYEPIMIGLLTGQLRFLGSTLLHTISSGILGILLGLSFFSTKFRKKINLLIGLILAVSLHSLFNFFIIEGANVDIARTLGFLWLTAVIVMLLFEKLKRMGEVN